MTHHDGGMRVMTAVKGASVEEWPKGETQHRTAPRRVIFCSDLTPRGAGPF